VGSSLKVRPPMRGFDNAIRLDRPIMKIVICPRLDCVMATKPKARQGKAAPAVVEAAQQAAAYELAAATGVPADDRKVDSHELSSASPLAFHGDIADVIKTMRAGTLASVVISQLAERVGVSQERLFDELRIPHDAVKTGASKNIALSTPEQDRLYRTEKVMTRAQIVFEDANDVKTWVIGRNRALGGASPLSLLDTEAGYELVLDTLSRIAYGVIS